MKKYIFFIIAILTLVIFISGCTDNINKYSNQSDINNSVNNTYNSSKIPTKTYSSANGVSFKYPKGWQRTDWSGVEYPMIPFADINMEISFGDIKTAEKRDGYEYYHTIVTIEKAQLPFGISLKTAYDKAYADPSLEWFDFKSISDTTTTVDGEKAYVKTYTVVLSTVPKKVKAVWFEKKGFIYEILLMTFPEDFDSEQANFDVILNSFKVK